MTKKSPKKGFVLWFTGLSGSGKSTTAEALLTKLRELGYIHLEHLDGDNVREWLCNDLGFSREDRSTNLKRVAYVSKLLSKNGVGVLSTFISPYEDDRKRIRSEVINYIEVFVDTPLEVCEQRDVKGLYEKARAGKIAHYTGISDPYEVPKDPDIHITTDISVQENCQKILTYLHDNDYLI